MKIAWQLMMVAATTCVFLSCKPQSPEEQFTRQKIPIEIQRGKPVTIEIPSLSGNGANDIGIQCSPELWNAITNGDQSITVRLKSSNRNDTEISSFDPRYSPAFLGHIPNVHYLFNIAGEYHANAVVEITFQNGPIEATQAEIIVGKTPADTGL
jgi:hypothetical protein